MTVFGGAICSPSCTVNNDVITFDSASGKWSRPITGDYAPMKRYRHTVTAVRTLNGTAADGTTLLVFGGESYKPSK